MPRQASPPRLWLRPARRNAAGQVTHASLWFILDAGRQYGTGCGPDDRSGAEQALADYINKRHIAYATKGPRPTNQVPVADVLTLYVRDVMPKVARPKETIARIKRLAGFFAGKYLSDINGPLCRDYAARHTDQGARRDLQDLRAAINHHLREGLHDRIVSVVMPAARPPRERWLTRSEAARLIWAAWRCREVQHGEATAKHTRRHLARFILVGLYTGSRASVIASAALQPEPGRPYVDTETGIYHRRPAGERQTKKRKPNVPLPPRLLSHIRRWKRQGARYVVEWHGKPVTRVQISFNKAVVDAGLDGNVTPHTLRHTAATWLMQQGADLWQAAGYLGMTVKTLESTYGHHHPGHFESVHRAFSGGHSTNRTPMIARNGR
jgi:integrase